MKRMSNRLLLRGGRKAAVEQILWIVLDASSPCVKQDFVVEDGAGCSSVVGIVVVVVGGGGDDCSVASTTQAWIL